MRRELEAVCLEISKTIRGKQEIIEKILMALLADGHILLDDVPGVGKTTLAVTLCNAMGLAHQRIQCTPDLLPSDITGFSMYDKDSGQFLYRPGIINEANLLLCDEINRASSRTQSALLEAMEERQVTVDGNTYPLKSPFTVIATQNSVGMAGTQTLPYAQTDRFLVCLSLGYPDYEAQMEMLRDRQQQDPLEDVQCVMQREDVLRLQQETRQIHSDEKILDYITRLTMASREHARVEVGISPRGALFLHRMARARACLEGRDYVTAADVQTVFPDVCGHRLVLKTPGKTSDVLRDLLRTVEHPDRRRRP